MSLRVIIVCIIKVIVPDVEGIAIVDATTPSRRGVLMRQGLEQGRSSMIFSSLAIWSTLNESSDDFD